MKYLILSLKIVLQLIACFISAVVLYVFIVLIGALIPSGGEDQGKAEVQMYVQSNGVHTDVCFPSRTDWFDWTSWIDPAYYPENNTHDYIAIGWGDKGFFLDTPTWADLKASTAVEAMFLASPCAMHVEYKDQAPSLGKQVYEEHISVKHYLAMVDYIKNSFVLEDEKVVYIPGTSYWGTDHFFEAKGNYHMLNTCNSWTNGALKAGGLRTALFAMFPGVICYYRN